MNKRQAKKRKKLEEECYKYRADKINWKSLRAIDKEYITYISICKFYPLETPKEILAKFKRNIREESNYEKENECL